MTDCEMKNKFLHYNLQKQIDADVLQTIIGRGFCDTPSRTQHSLTLLLEIMHCACNLQISH